ncbi:hypothetical protein CAEBREN_05849 [Caenorhabditis brenneri]|uniref:Uncharacterized protein n=1 Tax=Caenorhabditis brenneri TaxID=135651 RepID=G0MAB7_CAEBE|nr:hypothetical protein CAEBREN_05849 [Caenorhabditis brenneri]
MADAAAMEFLRHSRVNNAGEDCFLIFSRPEELACQDCEGLKHRFKRIWDTWYDIKKDREGFIILTCRPQAGLWLLKSTAVLGHFFTAEQQEAIQLRNGINCCL